MNEATLADLRIRLDQALAVSGLTKAQLAVKAGLGRTTVHEAFRDSGPPPSPATVAALARVLGLRTEVLLDLLRRATQEATTCTTNAGPDPGRSITEWDPHDLEVHPAGGVVDHTEARARRMLPRYVRRAHDGVLARAVRDVTEGRSRMLVLVGTSSTGKTRACWEAVQPLADLGWRLWHPFDPTRAEAALEDLHRVTPRTVVWINEAQHYLGDPRAGERIAAALHGLLTRPGPVLILGTLWPEYSRQLLAAATPNVLDRHSRARELLTDRTLAVPDTFDDEALEAAVSLARSGDGMLADALTRAHGHGRLAQDLAGAPELLRRYRQGTPGARAILEVAMDARRLGVGLHLPQDFLVTAAQGYLDEHDYDCRGADWSNEAFAELACLVHGKQAPLRRITPRPKHHAPGGGHSNDSGAAGPGILLRLADYLEQYGNEARQLLCPPASFWHAAYTRLTQPGDLHALAGAAEARHRLQWAHHLRQRAVEFGADVNDSAMLYRLAEMRAGAGRLSEAQLLYERAAEDGHPSAEISLALMWDRAGDKEAARFFYRKFTDVHGVADLFFEGRKRDGDGHWWAAQALYRQVADAERGVGASLRRFALIFLAQMRAADGDPEDAENLYRRAGVSSGYLRQKAGDWQNPQETGNPVDIADPAQGAVHPGNLVRLLTLARLREEAGDTEDAYRLYQKIASANYLEGVRGMVRIREKAGDHAAAEALAVSKAPPTHRRRILTTLVRAREAAGNVAAADSACRRMADAGDIRAEPLMRRWPYGLDPDGTPTPPWW